MIDGREYGMMSIVTSYNGRELEQNPHINQVDRTPTMHRPVRVNHI